MTDGERRFAARSWSPRSWSLWTLPRHALAFVLAVDVLAIVLGVAAVLRWPMTGRDVALGLVLALGAVVHLELARHIERLRNEGSADDGVPYIDAKSMWSFAGLVLLTPAAALLLVVFTLVWWRIRVSARPPIHRWVYSGATIVIASCAAAGVLSLTGPAPIQQATQGSLAVVVTLVGAALVRWTVNHGLVVAVISLVSPAMPWSRRLGSVTDNLIGMGALALGIALAVLIETTPWLVPVLLLPVLAMHRGVLLGPTVRAARSDPKTGLAGIRFWRDHAEKSLALARRRQRPLGVLMIDLDEFKSVNDRHGHLAGDQVLCAIATCLRTEVTADGAVGRFGGEEFVVLLADAGPIDVERAAQRIRRGVADSEIPIDATMDRDPARAGSGAGVVRGLTVSVGAATFPDASDDLDGLITAADAALYAAKRGGRNRVEIARVRDAAA